jgi:N-acetylneuraminate lyase/4-hydroxy-tetrahydrodipicolinate synthase
MPYPPKGIIPPLTTPFTMDGRVYEKGLRELVEFQVEKGSHGLFVCGTYGSGPLMTVEERMKVLEIVRDQAGNRITVIAHVGAASTGQCVELARHAERAGADCAASIPPYYYHHDERSVLEYFRSLASSVSLPVYVYNNPNASGVTITPGLLRRLADVGVTGMKDSAFSYIDFTHFVLAMEDQPEFRLIAGTEGIALAAWMAGARGCVSGLANAFPEIMIELWNLFEAGNYAAAAKLQLKVNRARQILHIPSSTNAATYYALHARGIDAGFPRPPVLPVEEDKGMAMLAAFERIGMLAGAQELAAKR